MITIIGQSPEPARDGDLPFEGAGRKRIMSLFGITEDELKRRFVLLNIFREYPGRSWPLGESMRQAQAMFIDRSNGPVLLSSPEVARSFGVTLERPWFDWFSLNGTLAAIIPDLRESEKWWDEPENMRRARDFLAPLVRDIDTEVKELKFSGQKLRACIEARIKAMPKGVKITREGIARDVGIKRTRFYEMQKGDTEPTATEAQALADHLGCSTLDFMEEIA